MRIVFLACQQIGVGCIESALKRGVEVPLVYTYELILDKTYGYDSVSEYCRSNGVPFVLNENLDLEELRACAPDLIVSAYYRRILKPEALAVPNIVCRIILENILPDYRGPIPTVWALLHGEKRTGVTLHYMDEGVDTGDIIFQKNVPITDADTGLTLYQKCMKCGETLFRRMIDDLLKGKNLPRRRQEPGGSYYGKMSEDMRVVNWKSEGEYIVNQARAFTKPYIGLEANLLNKRIIIWKASKTVDPSIPVQKPGRIVDIRDGKFIVTVTDGLVSLDDFEFFPSLNEVEQNIYYRKGLCFD